jgi:prepilin-type N-terminal cleavage/methylation domain-containing protein
MFHRKLMRKQQAGFTLIELLIGMVVLGVLTTSFVTFFNTSISQYLSLHRDSMAFGDLSTQSQRIANVLRGLTDITQAENNEITVYAYFAPNDTYVSLIHYYLTDSNTKLKADVTRMSANPPTGTPVAGSTKTFTIIDGFHLATNLNTFTYIDGGGTVLTPPISEQHTIKSIKVALSVPSKAPVANSDTTMVVQVSLRNRKTNL